MKKLTLPKPISCGIFITYKCPASCKHCLYASSPKWSVDFIPVDRLESILDKLSTWLKPTDYITFNAGVHFSGGEPLLNLDLLLVTVKLAKKYKISPVIIETNCFWSKDFETAAQKLNQLKLAGLDGILISINPFIIEFVNFKNIKITAETALKIFGRDKVIIYQKIFYELFIADNLEGKLKFNDFIHKYGLIPMKYMELLPMGRAVYKLDFLFKKYPAERFFNENCINEFQNPYHVHIDNYGNYIPSFCAGLALNNIFHNENLLEVNLEEKPIISALCQSLEQLYQIGLNFDYKINPKGYISKCHLCVDIRKHIVSKTDKFTELSPQEFYKHLND